MHCCRWKGGAGCPISRREIGKTGGNLRAVSAHALPEYLGDSLRSSGESLRSRDSAFGLEQAKETRFAQTGDHPAGAIPATPDVYTEPA